MEEMTALIAPTPGLQAFCLQHELWSMAAFRHACMVSSAACCKVWVSRLEEPAFLQEVQAALDAAFVQMMEQREARFLTAAHAPSGEDDETKE